MGEEYTLNLDGVKCVDRIRAQCGTKSSKAHWLQEMPQSSQNFLNGVLAFTSLSLLGSAPACKILQALVNKLFLLSSCAQSDL